MCTDTACIVDLGAWLMGGTSRKALGNQLPSKRYGKTNHTTQNINI